MEGEIRIGWRMGGLGMEVASEVAAGALLGWAFDTWRGTAPTGLLVGSIAGIVVGLWTLIRRGLALNRLLDQQYPTRGRGTPLPPDDEETGEEDDGDWDSDKTGSGGSRSGAAWRR
jgi:hypothetical protein